MNSPVHKISKPHPKAALVKAGSERRRALSPVDLVHLALVAMVTVSVPILVVDGVVVGILSLRAVGVGTVGVAVLCISSRHLGVAAPETSLLACNDGSVRRVLLASAAKKAVLDVRVRLLLLAVVLDDEQLVRNGEKEQDGSDNSQDPRRLEKSASVVGVGCRGAVGVTETVGAEVERVLGLQGAAIAVASSCLIGDGDEGTDEAEIKDHGNETESRDAAEEAREENTEERVESSSSGETFDGANPCRDSNA